MKKLFISMLFAGTLLANNVVFHENWDSNFSALNGQPIGWTVFPDVDIIQSGTFDITCYSGNYCIDMDGTGITAGGVSKWVTTNPNTNYLLTWAMSGSQRNYPDYSPVSAVRIGIYNSTGSQTTDIQLNWDVPWSIWAMPFFSGSGGPTMVSFASLTPSNGNSAPWVGLMLDNVWFVDTTNSTHMPEPGTYLLVGVVLIFVGYTKFSK